jgi:tRNA 2-thiouridine synthesizing protein C
VVEAARKTLLVVIRRSPYGSSLARAAVDAALAAAAFGQSINLLFLGDGVLHLLPGQESDAIGLRNSGRLLASLPLYDIESVYADGAAIDRYGIELQAAPIAAEALDANGMRDLVESCHQLLGF